MVQYVLAPHLHIAVTPIYILRRPNVNHETKMLDRIDGFMNSSNDSIVLISFLMILPSGVVMGYHQVRQTVSSLLWWIAGKKQ